MNDESLYKQIAAHLFLTPPKKPAIPDPEFASRLKAMIAILDGDEIVNTLVETVVEASKQAAPPIEYDLALAIMERAWIIHLMARYPHPDDASKASGRSRSFIYSRLRAFSLPIPLPRQNPRSRRTRYTLKGK